MRAARMFWRSFVGKVSGRNFNRGRWVYRTDTSNPAVNDSVSSRGAPTEAKRRQRSQELKRQLVEESLAPRASVARVARAHGVKANQVFAWRRQYRQGPLGSGKRGHPDCWRFALPRRRRTPATCPSAEPPPVSRLSKWGGRAFGVADRTCYRKWKSPVQRVSSC